MSSSVRKQAPRLPRPAARYWKGKAPKGADSAVNEDSDEEQEDETPQEAGDVSLSGEIALDALDNDDNDLAVEQNIQIPKRSLNIALKDVSISRDGKVTVAGREESGMTAAEAESEISEEEEEDLNVAQDDSEEESSEEESEDEQPAPMFQPVFIPKNSRVTVAEREAMAQDTEAAAKQKELEAEERKKQSHEMVAESIRRELAEKEKEENVPDVDDTDGLDPEAEFEAWRLRELGRIKRDKEEEVRREEERAEVERRRALPEEQRLREDLEHAESSRADKPKGQQKFLQKYWHKGAFHQDEEILRRHDFTEATTSTMDVSLLPKVMQVKNFGKRGRTKYTHLVDQDTTQGSGGFGGTGSVQSGGTSTTSGACFLCGGPHMKKDCPQNQDIPPGQRPGTGANGVGLDARAGRGKWDDRRDQDDRRTSWRDRDDRDDRDYRSGPMADRDAGRYRDRNSRSPRRERSRDGGRRRSRSRSASPYRDRRRTDDKRRRLD